MSEIVSLNALKLDESLAQFIKSATDHSHPGFTHHQIVFEFPNGLGASVIRGDGSYGGRQGLFELGVLGKDGKLSYSTPITGDVLGYLSPEDVVETLHRIKALPEEEAVNVECEAPPVDVTLAQDEVSLIEEAIVFFLETCDDLTQADREVAERVKEKIGGTDG